jgi:hypothetical protein
MRIVRQPDFFFCKITQIFPNLKRSSLAFDTPSISFRFCSFNESISGFTQPNEDVLLSLMRKDSSLSGQQRSLILLLNIDFKIANFDEKKKRLSHFWDSLFSYKNYRMII